jgi:hypothetical protein
VARPEVIDVEGPWWQGFYHGWRDSEEGRRSPVAWTDRTQWADGYQAGWVAYHGEVATSGTRGLPYWTIGEYGAQCRN